VETGAGEELDARVEASVRGEGAGVETGRVTEAGSGVGGVTIAAKVGGVAFPGKLAVSDADDGLGVDGRDRGAAGVRGRDGTGVTNFNPLPTNFSSSSALSSNSSRID